MADDRRPAYSEVLAALLALRPDPATDRFDALLSVLLAEDRIDPAAARELRWWQRESVRSVGDYIGDTAPALLVALESSRQTAEQASEVAARAWEQATRPAPPARESEPDRFGASTSDPSATTAPVVDEAPDVVVDLRLAGRNRARTEPPEPPSSATGDEHEPPPTAPYARAVVAPARHGGPATVASPTRRLLITGRSVHPSTVVVGHTGRPEA